MVLENNLLEENMNVYNDKKYIIVTWYDIINIFLRLSKYKRNSMYMETLFISVTFLHVYTQSF